MMVLSPVALRMYNIECWSFEYIEDLQMFLLNMSFYFTNEVDNIYIS